MPRTVLEPTSPRPAQHNIRCTAERDQELRRLAAARGKSLSALWNEAMDVWLAGLTRRNGGDGVPE